MVEVDVKVHDWNPPVLNIKTSGASREVDIDFNVNGTVDILQDGCGGWQCCSSHSSWFFLTKEHAIILRDFLNKWIIND